jgi:SAM-dependent methyltransferase
MPEGLLARIIRTSSKEGETVLDPFAGSGTTLATAAKLGRHFVGIDISPAYVRQCQARVKEALVVRTQSLNGDRDNGLGWPSLDEEALVQLYRDTRVTIETLEAIEPAMRCFLECLKARTGKSYSAQAVIAKLRQLARSAALPPIGAASSRANGKKDRSSGA